MSAGALAGVPSSRALKLLRGLARAHLLEEHAPQRFSQHDLLRLHARRCADADESTAQRRAAVVRLLDHYLHSVDNAERAIRVSRAQKPLTERDPVVEAVEFSDRDSAIAWCRREHDLLVELCEFALAQGHLEHSWKLPTSMAGYLQSQGSTADFLRLFTVALDGAQRMNDQRGEVIALHTLGSVHRTLHHYEESQRLLLQALRIRQVIGDPRGLAITESELAAAYLWQGHHDEALLHYRASAEHWQRSGDDGGRVRAISGLAWTLVCKGDFAEGLAIATENEKVLASLGAADPVVPNIVARAKFGLGDLDGAVRIYRDSLASSLPDRMSNSQRVEFMLGAAEVFAAAGDRQTSLSCAREALSHTERSRLPGAGKIRQLVEELEAATRVP
jgi:tetratricopeptide (TPR) repeat protein